MPGHMGAERHTELGLRVVKVDAERNLLFVRGAVPGAKNGIVTGEQAERAGAAMIEAPHFSPAGVAQGVDSRCPRRSSTAP